jgi:hypothetical protein
MLHAFVHIVECYSFFIEILILLSKDWFMIVKEAPKVIQLRVFQNLESIESRSDFLWRRDLLHFVNWLSQKMMLPFYKRVIIFQEVLQLLHTCDVTELTTIIESVRGGVIGVSILTGVEESHWANFFINCIHELTKSGKVVFEFLNEFFTCFFERWVEKIFSDELELVF